MSVGLISPNWQAVKTVKDLIRRSYQLAHVLGKGETLGHDQAIDGLEHLNDLIEQASIEKIFSLYETEIQVPLVAGQISYRIGPASASPPPDVEAVRPTEIMNAFSRRNGLDLKLFVTHAKTDYDSIINKSLTSSGWSYAVYYQATHPAGTIYVYPSPPDTDTTLFLTVLSAVAPFSYLEEEILLPPGYSQYLKYALAKRICGDIGLPFGDDNEETLNRCETALTSNNIKPMPIATTELVGLTHSNAGYNILGDHWQR